MARCNSEGSTYSDHDVVGRPRRQDDESHEIVPSRDDVCATMAPLDAKKALSADVPGTRTPRRN